MITEMTMDDTDADAVRLLVTQAVTHVGRAPVAWPDRWRAAVRRATGGRWGDPCGWPAISQMGTPWQDTLSGERGTSGWRERTAHLYGQEVFGVDYRTCRRCRLGWVEQPYTREGYERYGLASAALVALRSEQPGLSWHTLGGHMAPEFWDAVGTGVQGGYRQRDVCPHLSRSYARRPVNLSAGTPARARDRA